MKKRKWHDSYESIKDEFLSSYIRLNVSCVRKKVDKIYIPVVMAYHGIFCSFYTHAFYTFYLTD
jgi:hypothetical protein